MEKSIYKQAMQQGLRFNHRGVITTEDLWSLPVKSLDAIYKQLNAERKASEEDSLLQTQTKEDATLKLKIELLKDIVETKQEAAKAQAKRKELSARKAKIQEVLAEQQEGKLASMGEEDLKKMLAEVNAELSE